MNLGRQDSGTTHLSLSTIEVLVMPSWVSAVWEGIFIVQYQKVFIFITKPVGGNHDE